MTLDPNFALPDNLPFPVMLFVMVLGLALSAGLLIDIIVLILMRLKPLSAPDLMDRLRARAWSPRAILLLTGGLVGCFVLLQAWAGAAQSMGWDGVVRILIAAQTLVLQAFVIVFIWAWLKRSGRSVRGLFGLDRSRLLLRIGQGVVFYLAALPVVAFYGIASVLVLQALGLPVERQDAVRILMDPTQSRWLQLYLGTLAIVGAPITEELFFRGMVLSTAGRRMPLMHAVALVSLLFAAIHFSVTAFVPLFVFGMALALAYVYTGSILVPIVMHACFNTVSMTTIVILKHIRIDGM